MTGDKAQDFVDYLEKKSGLKLKYKTKNGVTTITGSEKNKDFKGEVNKEFAKTVKDVAGADGTAKFNVSAGQTNEKGELVFFDDNEAAFSSSSPFDSKSMRAGNVNMTSIQSVDSQDSGLAMALVGHFVVEGLEMRAPGANFDLGASGAHQTGLEVERKILSEALGTKQDKRFSPAYSATTGVPISFVYTTLQYDITIKSDGGAAVNRISPPTIARPKK